MRIPKCHSPHKLNSRINHRHDKIVVDITEVIVQHRVRISKSVLSRYLELVPQVKTLIWSMPMSRSVLHFRNQGTNHLKNNRMFFIVQKTHGQN